MISHDQRDYLIKLLKDGKDLPEDFKHALFPVKHKEYELAYAGKMRKEDVLANEDGVFPVPLQIEKVFNGKSHKCFNDDWKNMIVFGDNLQFLKTIYENKDPLIKDKIKGKVKLIYIDPPFASSDEFKNKDGAKAYNDKIKGAEFVEFLRRRLILAREILAEDGSIFVHLDQKMSHYIKVLMDEVFGKNNVRNEIIWFYPSGGDKTKYFQKKHDNIFFYSKHSIYYFNDVEASIPYTQKQLDRFKEYDPVAEKNFYWNTNPRGERIKTYEKDGLIDYDVWNIAIDATKNKYPTQKPEALLKKIISSVTQKGDIVFDFFGGSGRTAEVAEKLERRWITCDIGKLSYFTMQKRILQINSSKFLDDSKKKYGKNAKSFMTCSLGLYDLKKAFDLEWSSYVEFVSRLFEVEFNKHKISGFSFDGMKGVFHVKIWDYRSHKDSNVDESYLENIHEVLSGKVKDRVYIIAPVNNFDFLTDYHEIGDIKYYFLKIPYQVIKDLHKIPFQKLRQPQSKKNINDLDETIGFHFIKAPEVKSEIKKIKGQIKITIREFFSQYRTDDSGDALGNFEALSAVFIDRNYNGSQFVMTDHFFADDLLPNKKVRAKEVDEDDVASDIRLKLKDIQSKGLNILLDSKGVGKNIMVVYTDIFGNDFSEILKV